MTTVRETARTFRRFSLAVLVAGFLAFPGSLPAAEEAANSCFSCHNRLGGRLGPPAREFFSSVHREAGLTCVSCHGGNPSLPGEESMSPKYGFRGKPAERQVPELCARCHSNIAMMRQYNLRTDQLAEYRTSVHGRLLYEKNDANVAVCTSCHGKHDIRRRTDPQSAVFRSNVPATCGKCHADPEKMKPYKIPTDQLADFEKGVHGRILSGKIEGKNPALAPNCATCHGVHGATPPGIREVANVCGNCHSQVASYFRESPHFTAVREVGEPKCVTCHGNHSNRVPTLKVFSGTGPGECGSCHEPDSKAIEFARNVRDLLSGLESGIEEIGKDLSEAETSGRNIDRLKSALDKARNKLTEAGPVIHTFSIERILPLVQESDAFLRTARQEIRNIQDEQRQRRAVAAYAVTMLVLIAALLGVKLALLPRTPPEK
ncbi:MAG: cytochrome c3 family protein [Deltaproteobacteria bacterium]|nr:cytochrome c3 family protein [Deltaproteobacteria bacterium]